MTDEEKELEKHLQLMHMLAQVFTIQKQEHLEPYTPSLTYADNSPKRPTKDQRFTALKAKLEKQQKSEMPMENVDGLFQG